MRGSFYPPSSGSLPDAWVSCRVSLLFLGLRFSRQRAWLLFLVSARAIGFGGYCVCVCVCVFLYSICLEYLTFHNCTNSEHDSQRRGGRGSIWSESINYSQWFQPLICLMWYDILPRWLLVIFIHINEHHQLADWDKFPPSFLVFRQWNLVVIINQGHLSISSA